MNVKSLHSTIVFINPKSMEYNMKVQEKMRILTSLLGGIISGVLNLNQLEGPLIYLGIHLVMTLLIAISVGSLERVFVKKSDVFSGISGGALIFICSWMIVFNIVYVL